MDYSFVPAEKSYMDHQPADPFREIARLQGRHYVYSAFKKAVPIATPEAPAVARCSAT